MRSAKPDRGSFLKPLLALSSLGALGAATLLLTADAALRMVPPEQIAAAGGMKVAKAALVLQPVLLTVVASALGLAVAHKIGLRSAIVARLRGEARFQVPVMDSMLVGAGVGIVTIAADMLFATAAPDAFASLRVEELDPFASLIQGVLYGGLTEEILVRWGVLSVIAWLLVKLRLGTGPAKWSAVIAATLLFAVGHIPALAATAELSTILVVRTLLLNGIAGLAFGALFVRHNLEAAMVAHMTVHLCFFIARASGAI